jgi:transaldolase
MKPTQKLSDLGQSIWLDNITRSLLDNGQIQRYIDEYGVRGLTSNPSIFDNAISGGDYDDAIRHHDAIDATSEEIFFSLAIADLQRAADLFQPVHEKTNGVDGWVSLEVSPLLAHDTAKTVAAATSINSRARRHNLFVKIPGTPEGLPAIEECIAAGVSVNVTLLFDHVQYEAAANAYLRGLERRVANGLDTDVSSVASLFISRWDTAVAHDVPADLANTLGLAIGQRAYRTYRDLMESDRFLRLANAGARTQRLLWASTKTKDPAASDTLYVDGLASPFTVNTMPDATLAALYDHGTVSSSLARDGGNCDAQLARFASAGIDVAELATTLQNNGAAAFVESWNDLLEKIDVQRTSVK